MDKKVWERCLALEAEGRARIFSAGYHQAELCRTFDEKLMSIVDLEVLEGFANRRRVLGVDLPKWTQDEIDAIKHRKAELEAVNGKRKKRR
jgi:hypothetical protein